MSKLSERLKVAFGLGDDDYYEDDEELEEEEVDEAPVEEEVTAKKSFFKNRTAARTNERRAVAMKSEVCVFKISAIEDSKEIIETLLMGKAAVINIIGVHQEIAQRVIDFVAGGCYAMDGTFQKISSDIFIVVPKEFALSGDFIGSNPEEDPPFQRTVMPI